MTSHASGNETGNDGMSRLEYAEPAVQPTVHDAPVPEGLEDGITVDPEDPTRAWLVLRAPGKEFVYVLGSFNGYTAGAEALMNRDTAAENGTRWWIELGGLTPNEPVTFQYWVDGRLRVADPYSPLVIYPNERGFPPEAATAFPVTQFVPGAVEFTWTDHDFKAPDQEDLVIYELLLRDFLEDDCFPALVDALDYLERLGVNAIELMPVAEHDGEESWGYDPAFHLALDKHYGTPEQFKTFVNEAHARGIAVILDVVYNHATGQSPLIRLYNEGDYGPPTADNPWANTEATHPFSVFNDLNHESPLTQLWLDKANRYWVEEYHVDGYRFDLTGGFMQEGPFLGYNAERIGVLRRMMDQLWAVHPDTYVILEHLVENDQEWRELVAAGMEGGGPGPMLWHPMNREYSQSAMGYPTATDVPSTLERSYPPNWAGGIPVPNAVTYMESHDEQWLMLRNRVFGNQAGDVDVRDLRNALDRQKLVNAFFLTVPGPRMMWQFGELGYGGGPGECLRPDDGSTGECTAASPRRLGNKPIRWDYYSADAQPARGEYKGALEPTSAVERKARLRLYKTIAGLINLRRSHAIFRSPDTEVAQCVGHRTGRWIRLTLASPPEGEPGQVVIIGNFDVRRNTVQPTFPRVGTWYDAFGDAVVKVRETTPPLSLAAGEFRIYTDVKVPSPEPDIAAGDREGG